MKITDRQGKILNTIIQEYIHSAQPVSSQLLEKKYDFRICPATIRIEMQKLTDKGFLLQPHTSAGRIPTDRGYRFFVDKLIGEKESAPKDVFGFGEILKKEREDIFKFANHLVKTLAETSSNFSLLRLLDEDLFWKEGWGEVLKQPESGERNFVAEFNKLLEDFEENVDDLELNSHIKIFIGREIPFSKAQNFSIMVSKCHFPKREEGIISLLGPKRMAYDRNISLINSLTKLLEKF